MLKITTSQLCQQLRSLPNDAKKSALFSQYLILRFSIEPLSNDCVKNVGTIDAIHNREAVRNWVQGQLESPYYVSTVADLESLIVRFERRLLAGGRA